MATTFNNQLKIAPSANCPKNEKGYPQTEIVDGKLYLQLQPKSKWNDNDSTVLDIYHAKFDGTWLIMQSKHDGLPYTFEANLPKDIKSLEDEWKNNNCLVAVYIGNSKTLKQLSSIFSNLEFYDKLTLPLDFDSELSSEIITSLQSVVDGSVDISDIEGLPEALKSWVLSNSDIAELYSDKLLPKQLKQAELEYIDLSECKFNYPEIATKSKSYSKGGSTIYNYLKPEDGLSFLNELFGTTSLFDLVDSVDTPNKMVALQIALALCGINELPAIKLNYEHHLKEHSLSCNVSLVEDTISTLQSLHGVCPKTFTKGDIVGSVEDWNNAMNTLLNEYNLVSDTQECLTWLKQCAKAKHLASADKRFIVEFSSSDLLEVLQ